MNGNVMPSGPCHVRGRGDGFTLIELLVVIAIIALLIAMLMPSLREAKEIARRTICQSNLHHVGVGVVMYSNDFDGAVPLHMTNHGGGPSMPWTTYAAYWEGGWPVIRGVRPIFNLAILEVLDLIPDPRILYCPSMDNPRHTFETFEREWALTNEERLAEPVAIRVAYMFNPHYERPYDRLSDFPPDKTMAIDILIVRNYTAHADLPGWNVLYPDGRVELKVDDGIFGYIGDDDKALGHHWTIFEEVREELEMQ